MDAYGVKTLQKPLVDPSHDAEKTATAVVGERWQENPTQLMPRGLATVRGIQLLATLAAIGAGTVRPLMTLIIGSLVNRFNGSESSADLKALVNHRVLFLVYLFLGQWVLVCSYGLLFSISALQYSMKRRAAYLRAAILQDFGQISQGKVATDLSTSIDNLEEALSEKLGLVLEATSTVVTSLIIAFTRSWRLSLVLSSTIAVLLCSNFGTAAIDSRVERYIQEIDGQAAGLAEECFTGIRVITSCLADSKMVRKYAQHLDVLHTIGLRKSPILAAQYSISYFVVLCAYALAFRYGTKLLVHHEIQSGGQIVIVILCINQGTNALRQILPVYGVLAKAKASSERLKSVILAKPAIDALSPKGSAFNHIEGKVELKNVKFAYPSRPGIRVLDGVNLCFDAGKTTALIGPSGSGKSTIVGLLERWYDPTEGVILLDNVRLDTLNVKFLRSNIGLVQQDPTLFNDTVFYNVASGLYGTPLEGLADIEKRRRVIDCCIEAEAHTFIQALPQGYDTNVGERGNRLSGGQKQRIAIARAIISSPKILLFDEATSALDGHSERLIEHAIERISRGRTTVIISHKLSVVQRADRIIVMKSGHVDEEGNHQRLLDTKGVYARLYEAQTLDLGGEMKEETECEGTIEAVDTGETSQSPEGPTTSDDPSATLNSSVVGQERRSFLMCLFSIFTECQPLQRLLTISLVSCFIAGAVYPGQAILYGDIVTVFQYSGNTLEEHERFWSLMWFVVAIGAFCAFLVLGTVSSIMGTITGRRYREQYFSAMMQQAIPFYDKERNSSGDLTARLTSHTGHLQRLMTILSSLIVTIVNLSASSILSLVIAWRLALVALFGSLPVVVYAGSLRIRTQIKKSQNLSKPSIESAQYASEVIGAARTVAALTMETEVCRKFEEKMRRSLPMFYKNILTTMPLFAFSQSGNLLGMAFAFWYGGRLLADGKIDATQLWIVFIAVVSGGEAAAEFFASSNGIVQARNAANSISELRSEVQIQSDSYEKVQVASSASTIEFRGVHYRYPSSPDHSVLQGLSFSVPQSQTVAIVGPSGSGKSTIISLLERFYNVSSGEIRIGDSALPALDIQSYRSIVSLVSQETLLFQGTLRENILLGVSDSDDSDERLVVATRQANIHDFIVSLPEGYNTQCGNKGMAFSGGQRQRIAIARALIRNPAILLLDEATSALDSDSELMVLEALKKAQEGRTTVMVTHRLATVKGATKILVLGRGRIVEEGTHEQLIKKGGIYWSMCRSQGLEVLAN